jgi:hypothetical protein
MPQQQLSAVGNKYLKISVIVSFVTIQSLQAQKKYLPCIGVACYFLAVKIIEEEEVHSLILFWHLKFVIFEFLILSL